MAGLLLVSVSFAPVTTSVLTIGYVAAPL